MNANNLKSWQAGTSGNPKGRPKGSRNIKNMIRDMLVSRNTYNKLPIDAPTGAETPLEAIIYTLMIKSINGDVRASDVLLKYAVDKDDLLDDSGFFSQRELVIKVVNAHGVLQSNVPDITSSTIDVSD